MSGGTLTALYPRAWRARYGEELGALLEETQLGFRDRIDLVRGAIDAHLHPFEPSLVLAIGAVAALLAAVVGLWLKLGDSDGAIGRLGVVLAVPGYAMWLTALVAAAMHAAYGPLTAAAATVAMGGTAILGVALVGRSRLLLGGLLAAAGLAGISPPGLGWPLFAGAWTAIAFRLALDLARPRAGDGGARRAR